MRPLEKALFVLDRTAVLFIGLAAGAVVTMSFFPTAAPGGRAEASVTPPPSVMAASLNRRTVDPVTPRLAEALQEKRPVRIGVFGDSFGDGVWAGLYNILRRDPGFEVDQLSQRATGFTRYRSLNLLDDIRGKLDKQPVDIAIVSFGANDTQGIFEAGHGNPYMSEGWQRIVAGRVTAVVALLRERGAMVYWVGLPRMRDAAFDADIDKMNHFYAARMAALGVPYYDTVPLSVDGTGRYEPYLPADPKTGERKMARTNDGIHMTIPGYIHAMRGLSDRIRGTVAEARAENAHAAPPVAQAANEARPQTRKPS